MVGLYLFIICSKQFYLDDLKPWGKLALPRCLFIVPNGEED